MKIPIGIHSRKEIVETTALIDSGAEGQFLDSTFVDIHQIPTKPLRRPIQVLNVDGTPNSEGEISRFAWRFITIGEELIPVYFLVTSLGRETAILGLPWLRRINPKIDWEKRTLDIPKQNPRSLSFA